MYLRFFYYGRKLFLLVLIAFSVCFSTVSRADFVMDSVLTVDTGQKSTLKYKIASADVNDPTPNPCYQRNDCSMAVTWYYSGGSGFGQVYNASQYSFVAGSKTLGDIGAALYRLGVVGNESWQDLYGNNVRCIYFGYVKGSGGFGRFPGQSCHQVSIDPAQCYFDTGSASINYGVVSADRVNGQIAQTVIHASCTQDIRVKVISAQASGSMVNLRPDGRLNAKITINDAPMSDGYTFTATPAGTALNIKSELIASGEIPPGDFYGNAVVVITLA
ncbi:hypothetical protein AWY96_08735 [Serratia plymuthica]|uniref:MrpH family fimbial adhesin n=1 Tax=Serratia plymuthica TaxID=82996 RepID=UPI00079FDCD4|nr:hypothetical protein [Serratia plymuthica]KYQ98600.1 hypothetical protein AWY96_08735 [Serratia plymuthica]